MIYDTQPAAPVPILLAEDNAAHAALISRSLGAHHIVNRIYHVSDGEAALDYVFRRGAYADPAVSPRPHLVLLDLRLPKIDGLEVLQEIKTSPEVADLPVVILTTSAAEADVASAYARRANSYLVKPLDFAQFTQLMDDLSLYWLGWNYHPWS